MLEAQRVVLQPAEVVATESVNIDALREGGRVASCTVLLAVSYYLAARLGLGFRFHDSQIGVVWAANAVFLSALLLTRRERWWIVLATTALVHAFVMYGSVPAWRWSWQIAGNSAFVLSTVALLQRFAGLPLHFESRRQVFGYLVISFVLPALYGFTTPAFVRSLLGLESLYSPAAALQRTLFSNATGLLLVAPVVILGVQHGPRRLRQLPARRLIEAALMIGTVLAVGAFAFGIGPEMTRFPTLLLWPPLLWAALRFGPLGASAALFCIAALSIWGTAHQIGPFVQFSHADQVISLQLFWIMLSAPVLLLAATIREREKAEAALHEQRNQLAHITRYWTVGELSGAVAHELRQPLLSILANAEAGTKFLAAESPDLNEVRDILDDIAEQDRHAASVISHMRGFLKKSPSQFDAITLETVVRNALALGRSTLNAAGVSVHTRIPTGLPRVYGDPVQLLQVLVNLIMNACEAMSGEHVRDRHLTIKAALTDDDYVEVLVADTGVGLPRGGDHLVFEPFFTTKDKGLGLGLAICRSIAQAHGGRLWGENNPEGGATFHLLLPTESAHGAVLRP